MTTESVRLVENQSLAYRQSLDSMNPSEQAFIAQWYTTLKLALNTAQVSLEQLRSKVESTNSELAAVQYSQSELQILLNRGYLIDGTTPLTGETSLAALLAPGASRDEQYWTDEANLDDLKAALGILADSSVVSDETMTLEELLAQALAAGSDPAVVDGEVRDALEGLYAFVGEDFLETGWQGGASTDVDTIMADPLFQSRIATLSSHLGKFLGDLSLSRNSSVADLRQAIVGRFNVEMFRQTAMGSELGATILQYVGEVPAVAGASEETILAADNFSDIFAGYFGGEQFSVESLFAKVDVDAGDTTSVEQILARLQSANESKSSLSTLETLDLKVASQNYSNHLSLLTKMVSDRLTDVESMLREW